MVEQSFSFENLPQRIRRVLEVRERRRLALDAFHPAAVLIPILQRAHGPVVLFTRRSEALPQHGGQISFPGGRCDVGEDACTAALREAREEVALDPAGVEILGSLDDQPSVSRFVVTPVVGFISKPPKVFCPQEGEVVEPFEVLLEDLLDRNQVRFEWWDRTRMPSGAPVEELLNARTWFEEFDPRTERYKVYFFQAGPGPNRLIWGLTARILKDLLERVFGLNLF
ncbi:MAG: CoA pyrophosphatase [Acidobacteria bacterium]|nr:CoA pyrophosphatase [Acidobacteriota bacterium]